MSACLFAAGLSYLATELDPQGKLVVAFCLLFDAAYSIRLGPVPLVGLQNRIGVLLKMLTALKGLRFRKSPFSG